MFQIRSIVVYRIKCAMIYLLKDGKIVKTMLLGSKSKVLPAKQIGCQLDAEFNLIGQR